MKKEMLSKKPEKVILLEDIVNQSEAIISDNTSQFKTLQVVILLNDLSFSLENRRFN